jgi:hypothetical protein
MRGFSQLHLFLCAIACCLLSVPAAAQSLPITLNQSMVTSADGVYLVDATNPECKSPGTATAWDVRKSLIASTADFGETVLPMSMRLDADGIATDIWVGASALYPGRSMNSASSRVYRIDGLTGTVSVFAELEFMQTTLFSVDRDATAGIAGLAYNMDSDVLYASYLKDGRIYAMDADTGELLSTFDPWADYRWYQMGGLPWTFFPDRVTALEYNPVEQRLYYGVDGRPGFRHQGR